MIYFVFYALPFCLSFTILCFYVRFVSIDTDKARFSLASVDILSCGLWFLRRIR